MKEQILKIAKNLEQETITETEAQNLLLGLFGVSGQLKNWRDCEIKCRYREIYSTKILKRG